jgi:hypothetical protein
VAKAYKCDHCREYYLPWEAGGSETQVTRPKTPQEPNQGYSTFSWTVPAPKMMFVEYRARAELDEGIEWRQPDLCKPCYINAIAALVEAI